MLELFNNYKPMNNQVRRTAGAWISKPRSKYLSLLSSVSRQLIDSVVSAPSVSMIGLLLLILLFRSITSYLNEQITCVVSLQAAVSV